MAAILPLPLLMGLLWPEASCGRGGPKSKEARQKVPSQTLGGRVGDGQWGGDHIGLQVTDKGASIEHDCAHGAINEPLALDGTGRFDVRGTFTTESGGPATPERAEGERPARYVGRVVGQKMTLTITLTDRNEVVDTFILVHGQTPRVTKCL